MGTKSNKAMDIISSLKGLSTAAQVDDIFDAKKKAENDMKRQTENDSEAAKALAEELVSIL
jgi:hypothetical protein